MLSCVHKEEFEIPEFQRLRVVKAQAKTMTAPEWGIIRFTISLTTSILMSV